MHRIEVKSVAFRMGIDLGGTKTEAIAIAEDGRELVRRRVPTGRESDDEVIETVRERLSERPVPEEPAMP